MITDLKVKFEDRPKTAFYASETGKMDLDIYFGFIGEPQTNPPQWYDTLKWGAGNGVEAAMLKVLKDSGIVEENYDQKEHGRIDIEREGITIHGYIDAKTKDGKPIEIKSINNKNDFDIKKYAAGYPKENYVGQLAIYLDALDLEHGYLFASSIDGINRFWFDCRRIAPRVYKCGEVTVDLDVIYKRWAALYQNHVLPRVMPDVNQKLYKYPIETLDWTKLSNDKISKARTNKAVVGDWEITYSPWKDKIIELQGASKGYSEEEVTRIKELTKGYSAKK
jgi:hypothetical protein